MISYGARIICILAGAVVAAGFYFVSPKSNTRLIIAFARDYLPDVEDRGRQQAQLRLLAFLSENSDACDPDQRSHARTAVDHYFKSRARALAIAERYLAPARTEQVRLSWDEGTFRGIQVAVVAGAQAGLYARADFRPTAPELAALLDQVPAVEPVCAE